MEYIILSQPVIVNKLIITIPRVAKLIEPQEILQCDIKKVSGYGSVPTQTQITDYQRNVNTILNNSNNNMKLDICPSIDNLVIKQNQAQQICDNIEYQDKIKSEKIRLERNKQYLLKLKQQQEEIDKLNSVINTLDIRRQQRTQNADITRLLQYQDQKNISNSIRDLANERLNAQQANQLYLDVNINKTL